MMSFLVGYQTKGRISKRMFQKKKSTLNFPKNEHFLRVGNVRFSEKLACFVLLKHQVWDSPFYLFTDVLETQSMLASCSCIQFNTCPSNSKCVGLSSPPSNLHRLPFIDNNLLSFWIHSGTLLRTSLNFFVAMLFEFILAHFTTSFIDFIK